MRTTAAAIAPIALAVVLAACPAAPPSAARDAAPAPEAGLACAPVPLFVPGQAPLTAYTDDSICRLEPDGAVAFEYRFASCPAPPPGYTGCLMETATTLDAFEPDHGGAGIVEVRFCADTPLVGAVNLWYWRNPFKRYLPLLAAGESMAPGCRTALFGPEDACFPDWDSLPPVCRGRCGRTRECPITTSERELQLVAEWCTQPAAGRVRLYPVLYHPAACGCARDADCGPGRGCLLRGALGVCKRLPLESEEVVR